TTATDLGIAGSVARNNRLDNNTGSSGSITGTQIRGRRINTVGTNTALSQLNDGLGVSFDQTVGVTTPDIRVTLRNGSTLDIDLGAVYNAQGAQVQGQANTLGDIVSRINAAGNGNLTASIGADGVSLRIDDTSAASGTTTIADFSAGATSPAAPRTATDLGIAGTTTTGTINGTRLIGKLNSVSTSRILGGQERLGDNQLRGTYRNGTNFSLTIDTSLSLSDMLASIGQQSGGRLSASIDQSGNRIVLNDTTGGTGRLVILGAGDAGGTQMAEQLGLSTGSAGVASSTVTGQRLQRQYVSYATQTSQLNYGRGIGSGRFEIRAADGTRAEVNIGSSVTTVAEVVNAINSAGTVTPEGGGSAVTKFRARVNDSGDGIIIEDQSGGTGALAVRDVTGAVARSLFLAGTASSDNRLEINGSYERRLTVTPGDGLATLASAINNSGLNIRASTLTDGGANPFRLSVSSRTSGVSGAFTFDAVGADLGLTTTNAARDSLVFFGSDNATTALAVETSSNSVSGAIPGVTLELRQTTTTPATISVSTDVEAITKKVQDFITAYNGLVDSIASRSNFDSTANRRGVLLGDSVTQELRGRLQQLVQSPAEAVQSNYRFLFEVGVKLGTGGKLTLDGEALKRAIERDPRGVIDLFAARVQNTGSSTRELAPGITVSESTSGAVTSRGVMEILADTLESYTRSNTGVLTRQSSTIEDQIRAQNTRITTIDQRIEARRRILETQFIRMESSIGRLQSQGGNVSNIRQVTSGFGAG
ncbi:MAG: flagellar filament capping protein FliD, partial [Phycisphaerales bacterium]|nr:flagellar filament capping protein FliD [Phycisphaerales bacterium]